MKVAIYARVSSEEQRTNMTIETQLFSLRKYCEAMGHTIVAEYCDDGYTGRDLNRPQYLRMLEDARKHKFDVIMAYKLDRFHRKTINALMFMEEINRLNPKVYVILTTQNIDTSTAMGNAMMQITAVFAELESANISERSRSGTERAKAQGKICNRPTIPLSDYQIQKAKSIIENDPDISQRELAKQFDGISRTKLIRMLKEAGIITDPKEGQ